MAVSALSIQQARARQATCYHWDVSRGLAHFSLAAVVALAASACVVWPEGSGPFASPIPLARALELQGRGAAVLIDVRSEGSWAAGHIPGALNIPASVIDERSAEIRRMGKLPILYCG
jgi:hypothetical protein